MNVRVVVKIKEIIKKRGISLRELSRLTKIARPSLTKLSNGDRQNINFSHIERIAVALNITDIYEIIDFEISFSADKSN